MAVPLQRPEAMPNRSKQKGSRAERGIVDLLRSYGLEAYRVPLSGSAIGYKSDVEIRLSNQRFALESKVRSKGFSRIYQWLSNSDLVVVKADRQPPVAIIRLKDLADLIARIPSKSIETATSKPSPDPYLEAYSNEPQPVTISTDPEGNLNYVNEVRVNPMRQTTLRIASEEDLRARDEALEADRNRYR